jgi:hypothetical protein
MLLSQTLEPEAGREQVHPPDDGDGGQAAARVESQPSADHLRWHETTTASVCALIRERESHALVAAPGAR